MSLPRAFSNPRVEATTDYYQAMSQSRFSLVTIDLTPRIAAARTGRIRRDRRVTFGGLLWVLRT